MKHAALRDIAVSQPSEARPVEPGRLASSAECVQPSATHFASKTVQPEQIRGNCVIPEVAFHHASQPGSRRWHRFMPPPVKRLPDCFERLSHSLLYRQAHNLKLAFPVPATAVRESKEVKRLRLPFSPVASVLSRIPAEADQTRFVRVK
jgi:hypothetical protein